MTDVTWRLTAENRDQLRNPTLGNRVWATFTFMQFTPRDARDEAVRRCELSTGDESVPKIVINNTMNLHFKAAISIRFILFAKYIYILALETASPGNRHCATCIGTLSSFRTAETERRD